IGMLVLVIFSALGNLKNRILVSIPIYTFTASLLFVLVGAASVFDAESRSDDSNIRTREDALWWAVVTIFTVGYGDRFPVTSEGRLYGIGLMICGIAIVGSVTATFASWLVNQVRRVESENERIEVKLDRIEDSLRRIQS
ncbi:MAG: pH-gated potassium channel KcsA, partial [Actinomycetota bacterium]